MIRRTSPLRKGQPPKRKTRPNPVNKKRKAREFARTYHSKERVEWVKGLGCLVADDVGGPCAGQIDNAHIEIEGKGRKAHYSAVIPLCRHHHFVFGKSRPDFENFYRLSARREANRVEYEWQKHLERTNADV